MAAADHVLQLNLVGPRDFLLQLEDELDAFVEAAGAVPAAASELKREHDGLASEEALIFPSLAQPYTELLQVAARRYLLAVTGQREKDGGSIVTVRRSTAGQPRLPLLGYGDFLRPQRPQEPPAPTEARLARLTMRLHALGGTSAAEASGDEAPAAAVARLQAAVDARLRARAAASGCVRPAAAAEAAEAPRPAAEAAVKEEESCAAATPAAASGLASPGGSGGGSGEKRRRGRGFDGGAEPAPELEHGGARLRHDYVRFHSMHARVPLYWRKSVMAAWPTAKLRRLRAPPVSWRPEWRVGPDQDDPPLRGPQTGLLGGVLSWAVESGEFAADEGFEVSLRAGPGPVDDGRSHGILGREEGPAERDEDDFVLSFRRGPGAWSVTAGKRSKLPGLASKSLPDRTDRAQRCSFWVACLQSATDGKHYVLVGRIPGILVEHFFVAKVARAEPLSHAGFSYLPPPFAVDVGGDPEGPPLVVESITVYPHGLTGELPFVSTRFVEQAKLTGDVRSEADDNDILARAEFVPAASGGGAEGEEPRRCELRVRKRPLPAGSLPPAGWCNESLLECGFPAETPADREAKLQRRAKMRRTAPVIDRSHMLDAPASWEPQAAELPPLGEFDDTLRHDPAKWAGHVYSVTHE